MNMSQESGRKARTLSKRTFYILVNLGVAVFSLLLFLQHADRLVLTIAVPLSLIVSNLAVWVSLRFRNSGTLFERASASSEYPESKRKTRRVLWLGVLL